MLYKRGFQQNVGQKLIYVVVQNSFVLEMDLVKNEILISRKKTNSYS
jgi:hypothetical protein